MPRSTLQAWRAYQERLDACPAVVAFLHRVPGLAFLHRLVLALHLVGTAVGACGMRLGGLWWKMTGRNRCGGASSGTPHQVNRRVEEALVVSRHEERARRAPERPPKAITRTQEATCTGGLWAVGLEPVSHSMGLEQAAQARDHAPWQALMAQALAGLNGPGIPSTSDAAPGRLAYVAHPLGAHHAPDLCHVQPALRQAVSAPMAANQRAAAQAATQAAETRTQGHEPLDTANGEPAKRGPGRPPQATASREPVAQDVAAARHEPQRLAGQRETVTPRLRAIGHASHGVDLERGVRRNGTRIAGDIQRPIDTIRPIAQHAHRSETCLERLETAARVGPQMQATIAFVSGDVRQQGRQWDVAPPASYAMPAHRMPSLDRERVASTRTVTAGEPLRALAERLRTPRCAPGGAVGAGSPMAPNPLKDKAKTLAEVCQRSSANVEGRHGDRSLRHHPLRGLDHPRKRAWLTAMHHFVLTRTEGTTAAERFFGQKPRSMCAAIWASVARPPAPLSPPRRAVG